MNIDINEANNGIHLPRNQAIKNAKGSTATVHAGLHRDSYKQHVCETLKGAITEKDFRDGLDQLKKDLASGMTFPRK